MEYAQRIRGLREDKELTQAQIAQLLDTTRNQIGKYERGEQELPIRHLITLANFYNVSTDFILGMPEGMPYGHSKTKKRKAK